MAHEELSPLNITPGAIRFNTDSMKLEYFRIGTEGGSTSSYAGIGTLAAGEWVQITTDTPDIQTGGTRGLRFGGATPSDTDTIDYINIDTTGNAIDFGNLTSASQHNGDGGMASRTRGFYTRSGIQFVTTASTGNATSFGSLADSITNGMCSASDSTRGVIFGGFASPATLNVIQYITMASLGNGVDFGDLDHAGANTAVSSSTRAICTSQADRLSFVTINTLGDSADFGDSSVNGGHQAGASNSIRGVFFGGEVGPASVDIIEYITISTLGDAMDFGNLSAAQQEGSASSSPTRATYSGGGNPVTNEIQYVQIMTTGNAIDFGDLTQSVSHVDCCSNGHGGLG